MDGKDLKHGEKKAGEPLRTYPRVDKRHAAYKILVDSGIDKKDAALILGYKPKTAYEIEKRLEKKGKRIEITSETLVRPAVRNLKKLIKAERFGEIKEIKDSTVLAAINTVLDRSHPKKVEREDPTYSFTQINLAHAGAPPDPPDLEPVDITPTPDAEFGPDEEPGGTP